MITIVLLFWTSAFILLVRFQSVNWSLICFSLDYNVDVQQLQISITKRIVLGLFWILLHLVVSIVHLLTRVTHSIEGYVISVAQPDKYQHLQLNKLRYLAVVVDSEEALTISKVVDLLSWLSAIGIKHVNLYDAEGLYSHYCQHL